MQGYRHRCRATLAKLQLQSYTLQQKYVLRGVMQCYRLVGKGESSASIGTAGNTVVWWAEVRWKCVPDDGSRDGETSLADGRVCPRNEQVTTASRVEWPTWQTWDWADDLLEVDRTSTANTIFAAPKSHKLSCLHWLQSRSCCQHARWRRQKSRLLYCLPTSTSITPVWTSH